MSEDEYLLQHLKGGEDMQSQKEPQEQQEQKDDHHIIDLDAPEQEDVIWPQPEEEPPAPPLPSHRSMTSSISSHKLRSPKRDHEQVMIMKRNLIFDIDRFIKNRGYRYDKSLTMATSLEELQLVFDMFQKQADRELYEEDLKGGVKTVKKTVINGVQLLENLLTSRFVTSRIPFLRMKGVTQSVAFSFEDQGNIRTFERLYLKYKMRDFLPPELSLAMSISMTMFMYQTMNSVIPDPTMASAACNMMGAATSSNVTDRISNWFNQFTSNNGKQTSGSPATAPAPSQVPAPQHPSSSSGPTNIQKIIEEMM